LDQYPTGGDSVSITKALKKWAVEESNIARYKQNIIKQKVFGKSWGNEKDNRKWGKSAVNY
jgi:hypothetical protein